MAANSLISVIDDDQSMCRMLARGIGAAGLQVAVFTSAEEFLASGRIDDSACLILDVDLPGISGIQLQQRIKVCSPRVPIIFISGQASDHARDQVLKAGAVAFFSKPFSIASLLAVVESNIGPIGHIGPI